MEIFHDHRYMAAIRNIRVKVIQKSVHIKYIVTLYQSRRPSLVSYGEDEVLQSASNKANKLNESYQVRSPGSALQNSARYPSGNSSETELKLKISIYFFN